MELKNYQDLIDRIRKTDSKKRVAVAAAHDEHTLEAVFRAADDKLVEPVLIGNKAKIIEILKELNVEYD